MGAGERLRLGPGRMPGGGARGEQNARMDPSTASLMGLRRQCGGSAHFYCRRESPSTKNSADVDEVSLRLPCSLESIQIVQECLTPARPRFGRGLHRVYVLLSPSYSGSLEV